MGVPKKSPGTGIPCAACPVGQMPVEIYLGIKTLLVLAVIEVLWQRPACPGLCGQFQVLAYGDMGDGAASGDFVVGQLVVEFES